MTETVLVVEDDLTILESIKDYLTLVGFDVIVGHNGLEGLEQIKKRQPDVVVSDIAMPKMDGYQFFEQVRANPAWISIPFMFLTAKGKPEEIRAGYGKGVDHYITKPFDPDELVILIRNRLQRAQEVRTVLQRQIERLQKTSQKELSYESREHLELIREYLEIYQREKSRLESGRADQIAQVMSHTLERMVHLLEDLMLIVYIDSGAGEVEIQSLYQKLDLVQELRDVFEFFKNSLAEKDVSLNTFVPDTVPISGHAHFTRDIFQRLVENALKFSQPGGNIWVELNAHNETVSVSIRDEGMGISQEQIQTLLSQFQDPGRIKIEKQGSGLGLAITSRLIRLHGGEIQVESTLGKGSTFTVILPMNLGEQ